MLEVLAATTPATSPVHQENHFITIDIYYTYVVLQIVLILEFFENCLKISLSIVDSKRKQ
jgi:hypothetical protein